MRKRTMAKWTIILSIVSLAFILLSYFGVIRFLSLHYYSTEGYTKNYAKLPKTEDRVVVTFSTSEKQAPELRGMVNSVLDQTMRVDLVALNTSDGEEKQLPNGYTDIISVFPVAKNYGKLRGLIPTLARELDDETMIIFLQDDMIYGKDVFEQLIDAHEKQPNKAISSKGALLIKASFVSPDILGHGKTQFDDNWLTENLLVETHSIGNADTMKSMF